MADFPRGTRVIPVCSTPLPANKLKRKSVGQFTEMRALATRPSIAIRELPRPKGTNSKSGKPRFCNAQYPASSEGTYGTCIWPLHAQSSFTLTVGGPVMRLLSVRLIVSLIVGITLVSLGFSYYQVIGQKRALRSDLERRAEVLGESVAGNVEKAWENGSEVGVQRVGKSS